MLGKRRTRPGRVLAVACESDGRPSTGINGGPAFTVDEAACLPIQCADQAGFDHFLLGMLKIDRAALTAAGVEPGVRLRGRPSGPS